MALDHGVQGTATVQALYQTHTRPSFRCFETCRNILNFTPPQPPEMETARILIKILHLPSPSTTWTWTTAVLMHVGPAQDHALPKIWVQCLSHCTACLIRPGWKTLRILPAWLYQAGVFPKTCSFIPVVTMVTTLLVGQAHVILHVLSYCHLTKTTVDCIHWLVLKAHFKQTLHCGGQWEDNHP